MLIKISVYEWKTEAQMIIKYANYFNAKITENRLGLIATLLAFLRLVSFLNH